MNFVNTEAGIATDQVFSREAFRHLDGSSDRPERSNKGKGSGKPKTFGDHARTPHQVLNHATDSNSSFVLVDIVSSVGVEGTDIQLVMKTVNGTKLHDAKVLNGLVVSDLKGENTIQQEDHRS